MEFSVEYSITKIFDSYSPSEDSKNVRALDMALDATSSGSPVHCSVPVAEPPQQGDWVTEAAYLPCLLSVMSA